MEQWRKQLVIDNEKLAYHGVKKYATIKDDEAKAVALEALTDSALKFDRTLGTKFSTYAMCLIQRKLYFHNKVRFEAYRQTINGQMRWVIPPKDSLDKIVIDSEFDHFVTLGDTIPSPKQDLELRLDLQRWLKSLSERDRMVLELTGEGYTQVEIAKVVNISQSYVARLVMKLYKQWHDYLKRD